MTICSWQQCLFYQLQRACVYHKPLLPCILVENGPDTAPSQINAAGLTSLPLLPAGKLSSCCCRLRSLFLLVWALEWP